MLSVHPCFWTDQVCQDAELGAVFEQLSVTVVTPCSASILAPVTKQLPAGPTHTQSMSIALTKAEVFLEPKEIYSEERSRATKRQVTTNTHLLYCSVECGGGSPPLQHAPAHIQQGVSNQAALKQCQHFLRELPNKSVFPSILSLNLSTTWLKHFPFAYYRIV